MLPRPTLPRPLQGKTPTPLAPATTARRPLMVRAALTEQRSQATVPEEATVRLGHTARVLISRQRRTIQWLRLLTIQAEVAAATPMEAEVAADAPVPQAGTAPAIAADPSLVRI